MATNIDVTVAILDKVPLLALAGKTRASTLRRYVTTYSRWRLWLREAKDGRPPGLPADLADYIMARGDEPCGRTVPEAIMKAVCWIERVAEWADSRATTGRIAWAMKDTRLDIFWLDGRG